MGRRVIFHSDEFSYRLDGDKPDSASTTSSGSEMPPKVMVKYTVEENGSIKKITVPLPS